MAALVLVALAAGCQHEAGRAIVVEADTTSAVLPAGRSASPARTEVTSVAPPARPPATASPHESDASGTLRRETDVPQTVPESDATVTRPIERQREDALVVVAGTPIQVELSTPLHSATTLVGDRFAARVSRAVRVGGRVAIPVGSLVEGRVLDVTSADRPDRLARIDLDFRTLTLPAGRRIALDAEIVSPESRPVERPPSAGRRAAGTVAGGAAGAVAGRVLGGSGRSAALGAALGAVAGSALVAGSPDREIVLPSGTALTIIPTIPLTVPIGA